MSSTVTPELTNHLNGLQCVHHKDSDERTLVSNTRIGKPMCSVQHSSRIVSMIHKTRVFPSSLTKKDHRTPISTTYTGFPAQITSSLNWN